MALRRTVLVATSKQPYRSGDYYFQNKAGFLRKLLPQEFFQKMNSWFAFLPDDPHNMQQVPPANMKQPGVERIKGYRSPAPGSQPIANIPDVENEDLEFDIKYFSRDVSRLGHLDEKGRSTKPIDQARAMRDKLIAAQLTLEDMSDETRKLFEMEDDIIQNIAAKAEEGDEKAMALVEDREKASKLLGLEELLKGDENASIGSPGTHYTLETIKEYDSTGLRSAMTATHEERYKALQALMPNHLPRSQYEDADEALETENEERWAMGLPPKRATGSGTISNPNAYDALW